MADFYTILTNYGKAALAEALASRTPLAITELGIGDSEGEYYEPTEDQTQLRNELYRANLNDLHDDSDRENYIVAEAVVPPDAPAMVGWYIREVGLYDSTGGLIAVGKYPITFLPGNNFGGAKQVYIKVVVKVDNIDAVELIIDHSIVLATKADIDITKEYINGIYNEFTADDGIKNIGLDANYGIPPDTNLTLGNMFVFDKDKGYVRMGGADLTSLNDEMNYWRGLPGSQNAWDDEANIGLFSVAFNRNNAAVGYCSSAFGHDSIAYGAASLVVGAGNCTGNPDTWQTDLFSGYCAVAMGKNNNAAGEKSAAIGDTNLASAPSAISMGYRCETKNLLDNPPPTAPVAIGDQVITGGKAYGLGAYIRVNQGVMIGQGLSSEYPLVGLPDELGIGFDAEKPQIRVRGNHAGTGEKQVGINFHRGMDLDKEFVIGLSDSKSMAIVTESFGSSSLKLCGLKSDGTTQTIFEILWTNPNGGTALGELAIRVNGRSSTAFGILSDGTIMMSEIPNQNTINGKPAGTIYKDTSAGNVLKII